MQTSDFIEIIPDQPNLVEVLAKYDPIAIIPGTEEGVPLAEALAINLTPQFANDPEKSQNRLHKAMMQKHCRKLEFLPLRRSIRHLKMRLKPGSGQTD